MAIELKVPALGESISEVEIAAWLKAVGDWVERDEPVVALETEKATVELPAPDSGTLTHQLKRKGEAAAVGEIIGYLDPSAQPKAAFQVKRAEPVQSPKPEAAKAEVPLHVTPAAEHALAEHGLRPEEVAPLGPGRRLLKEDVLRHLQIQTAKTQGPAAPEPAAPTVAPQPALGAGREEQVVPMSRLRRTIAQRLVDAQHQAALLTTFNEIDMSAVVTLRREMGEAFQKKYQVKLGLMSFFVKASIDALKQFPAVNSELRGNDIVFRNYYDIGIAVSSERGLVVPVLRNAERMSFAEVELAIADFSRRARENKLKLEELQGGTFTITNGGVFGSLLSTPIINPPQSGILGMHAIQDRPVAREGAVVVRPMMYVALTYDHRVVDGREAVTFLRRVKEAVETPVRMLLET